MSLRSAETFDGMANCTGNPSAAPSMANAIPVLPLVASSSDLPAVSKPRSRASATMDAAARSFTLPPGLFHSALANSVMPLSPLGLPDLDKRRVADALQQRGAELGLLRVSF